MIPIHSRPKQLCLGGIKFVNSDRILCIVVGRSGKLDAYHAHLLHKLRWKLIWIQMYNRQLNRKQRCRTNIMYVQSIRDYLLLPIWQSLDTKQHQQLARTVYKGAWFIFWAPATVDGSRCEIILIKRYYRITIYEEGQLTIPPMLHSLSQLDPHVEVINLNYTRHCLEQRELRRLWGNTVEFPNAQHVRNLLHSSILKYCFRSLYSG